MNVLKNRNVLKLIGATGLLFFSYGFYFLCILWHITEVSGSSSSASLIIFISTISAVVVVPIVGPLLDRYSRHMVWGKYLFAYASLLVMCGLLYFYDYLDSYLIYGLMVFEGILFAITFPSMRSLISEIFQDEAQKKQVNILQEISYQIGFVISGITAGLVMEKYSFGYALVIAGGLFLLASVLLLTMNLKKKKPSKVHMVDSNFLNEFIVGLKILKGKPKLLIIGVLGNMPFIVNFLTNTVNVSFVKGFEGFGPTGFGLMSTCFGIGSVLSGFFVFKLGFNGKEIQKFTYMVYVSIALLIALVFAPNFYAAIAIFTLYGLFSTGAKILYMNILLESVEDSISSRIYSILACSAELLIALFSLLLGLALKYIEPASCYLILAFLLLLSIVIIQYVTHNRRRSTRI